ncbi:unnamed protein product [Allacma fusca]|uniref:C2H2-type domain-containing protein n=1 Tax=Allacma fusca TaxID=39272 RepID=A0A8J2L1E7_9HEXA|nr:unnamed protein product [Allacma fusca]
MDGLPPSNLEERLVFLEREANFWRVKFEELEKWRENLEDWVLTNFEGETNTRTAGGPVKFGSLLSSPSNGWSPDSSDISSLVNTSNGKEKGKRRGRRKKHDIDYKEGEEADDGSNNVPVPKRKRGRPKKTDGVSVIACAPGPNPNASQMSNQSESTPEIKSESNENTLWETEGESVVAVPVKRGRGRPKKLKTENGEIVDEDGDKQKKKSGRKKREPGMPFTKTCDICGLEFDNNQDLLSHKRVIHPEKFHKCNICNDTYLHAGFLARHMETHTLDRDYKCHLCISSFNTYQLLKTHCLEKHGVDLGRQSDWKRDTELAMILKNQEYGQQSNEDFGLQSSRLQSQPMISSAVSNCHGNELGRNNLVNHSNISSHSQLEQQQQQQHSIIQQHPQHSHHQSQMHHQHHMQQQSTPPPHVHHSQLQQPHHHHQQQHHHHHTQRSHHHHLDDDDDVDIDSSFPLDFGSNGPDTLPPLFDPSSNDAAMNNYLNNMDSDPMQLY